MQQQNLKNSSYTHGRPFSNPDQPIFFFSYKPTWINEIMDDDKEGFLIQG